MQNPESAKPVKAIWHMQVKLDIAIVPGFVPHNYFKCKQIFGMPKAVGFSPTCLSTTRGVHIRPA